MKIHDQGLLVPPPSRLPRRTLLLVVTVFWAYVSFTTVAQWELMHQALPTLPALESSVNAVTCALMFPVLLLLTFVAHRGGHDPSRWQRSLPMHLGFAALFGLISRPAQLLARAIAGDLTLHESIVRMLGVDTPVVVRLWASNVLYDGMQYLFLQGLVAGFTFRARFRHEQALRESLAVLYDRARLNALRMQISPHFLYNTLSAIAGLVGTNPHAAELMVTRLGDLFRRALAERDLEMVTLEQELEYAENYLEIQRIRFEGRLSYAIDVDPALLTTTVPPLLLQPLLENAVEHGLRQCEGAVDVSLVGRANGSGVEIVIRNRSEGRQLDGVGTAERTGLGLNNVRARLEAAYAGAGELAFRNLRPGEYESRVSIPREFRGIAAEVAT